jgi:hypothetical protein
MRHLTALGLGEDVESQAEQRAAALNHQFLNRLQEHLVKQSRGEALNQMVRELLDDDEEYAKLEDIQEMINYRNRTHGWCLHVFWKKLNAL